MSTMPVSNFTPLTQTVVNGDLERFQEAHLVQTSSSSVCSGQPDSVTTAANSIRSFVSHQQQRLRQRSAPPAAPRAVAGSDQDSELDEIARQIADHAEALYQTWRARGLTAEDRLLCPANTASLNSVAAENLARRLRRTTSPAAPPAPPAAAPLSNTNLRTSISPLSDAVTRTRLEDSKKSGNPVHERTIPIQLDAEARGAPRLNGTHTKRAFSVDPQDPIPQARESLQKLVKSFVEEDKARRLGLVTRQTGDTTADSSAARHNITAVNSAARDHSNSDRSGLTVRRVSSSRDAVATAPAVASHTSRLQVTTNGQTRIVQNGEYHIPPAASVAQTSSDMFSNDSLKTAIRCPADGGNSVATKDTDVSPSGVADEVRRHETRLRSSSLVAAAANNSPAMSTVDYAKRRLQEPPGPSLAAQRLTDARVMTSMATAGSVAGCSVQETRSRYDHGQVNISDTQWRTDWLTADHDDMERCAPRIAAVHAASGAAEPIWRRKKSADPQHQQQQQARVTSPLPHPQLTAEQKQHIRQRSLTPYSAAGVAVRPFLTRGSVAERVLIFERCPVDLKTTERAVPPSVSAGGAALQALSAWRGPNDVRDKTQIRAGG